jgi:hypothetical protein
MKQPHPPPAARADANAGGNIMAMLGQVPPPQPAVQAPHSMQQLLQPQPQKQPPRAAAGANAGSNILAMLGQQVCVCDVAVWTRVHRSYALIPDYFYSYTYSKPYTLTPDYFYSYTYPKPQTLTPDYVHSYTFSFTLILNPKP